MVKWVGVGVSNIKKKDFDCDYKMTFCRKWDSLSTPYEFYLKGEIFI